MIKDVFQCCYTNATEDRGGIIVSHWGSVAVSSGVPQEALEGCTRYQKGNSDIWRVWRGPTNSDGDPLGDDGNVLNLLEVAGDGSYLYLIRSQYGLKDVRGRRNMFSHAYILPWNNQMLRDPNVFLTVSDSCFVADEAEALVERESLEYDEPLSIDEALALAHIETDDELALLVSAVYEQMTNTSVFTPLFVRYDGTVRQLRAFLFCLYSFLPLHLRRRLVSASAEGGNTSLANVVFCLDTSSRKFFFDSTKNTSNVISPARKSAIKRLGFVDYAARNRKKIDVQRYFEALEQTAQSFNASSSSAAQVARSYRIAHTMLVRPDVRAYSDDQLDLYIDEVLRLASHSSDALDNFLAAMLDEVVARSLQLSQDSETDLAVKLQEPHSSKLAMSSKRYNLYRFEMLSTQEAAYRLAEMGARTFGEYISALKDTKRGCEILDAYYANLMLQAKDPTWDMIDDVVLKAAIVKSHPNTDKAICDVAWQLYCTQVANISGAVDALDRYMDLMVHVLGEGKSRELEMRAKEEFWRNIDVHDISREHSKTYEQMNDGSAKAREIIGMLDYYELLAPGFEDAFLRRTFDLFRQISPQDDRMKENELKKRLLSMIHDAYQGPDRHLGEWMVLASKAGTENEEEWLETTIGLRHAIVENRRDVLLEWMERIEEVTEGRHNGSTFKRGVCNALLGALFDLDELADSPAGAEEGPLPVDVWLAYGDLRWKDNVRGGPFMVFDERRKPAILFEDPYVVVSSSSLLMGPRYQEHAKRYIRSKGIEAQTVNAWLKELRAQEKRQAAAQAKAESRARAEARAQAKAESRAQARSRDAYESVEEPPIGNEQNAGKGFFGRLTKGFRNRRS